MTQTAPAELDHSGASAAVTATLECLTDEELAVLSVADAVAVSPHLSAVAPRDRGALLETAYRGLVARGIVSPPTAQARSRARAEVAEAAAGPRGPAGPSARDAVVGVDVQVRDDVATIVTLRRGAQSVVAMARTAALIQDYVYAYVVDDVVLVEIVSSDGFHRFSLVPAADLVTTVLAAAIHPEAGGAYGESVAVTSAAGDPTPPSRLLEEAGAALLRCDVTVLVPGEDHRLMLGVFSAPAGSWLFRSEHGSAEPVQAQPMTVDGLRAAVADLVRPLVKESS